jgi:hypothetical protein
MYCGKLYGMEELILLKFPQYPKEHCKPFTGGTWVTEAIKDEGTAESCSIATLMKHPLLFINSFFAESIWSEKACRVLHIKVTLAQGSTVKLTLCYVSFKMGTEK